MYYITILSLLLTAGGSVRVAFLADSGVVDESRRVLELISDENADFVVHAGDLGYEFGADEWMDMVNGVLGGDIPYFVAVGDREDDYGFTWFGDYAPKLQMRPSYNESCEGTIGIKMVCERNGIVVVLSAFGSRIHGDNDAQYIDEVLSERDDAIWKICVFHRPEADYQVANFNSHPGYEAYEICRQHGAFIVTANTHLYSRSYSMRHFENNVIASKLGDNEDEPIELRSGETFAIGNGVGGYFWHNVSEERIRKPWIAAYGGEENSDFGALFCDFDDDRMECYFKDIRNIVRDRFYVRSFLGESEGGNTTINPPSRSPITRPRHTRRPNRNNK